MPRRGITSFFVVGFVALAVARLLLLSQERFVRTSIDQSAAQVTAYAVASIIPLLIPVAVALRDPNAWARNRMLVLGAATLAIGISLGSVFRLFLASARGGGWRPACA